MVCFAVSTLNRHQNKCTSRPTSSDIAVAVGDGNETEDDDIEQVADQIFEPASPIGCVACSTKNMYGCICQVSSSLQMGGVSFMDNPGSTHTL